MVKVIHWACLAILSSTISLSAQEPPSKIAKWSIVQIQIEKKAPYVELFVFDNRTTVSTKVTIPGKLVIGFDPAASVVETFTDDKKTNLLETPFRSKSMKSIDRDTNPLRRDPTVIALSAPGIPAPGATKIRVKGKAAMFVGANEKVFEKKNAAFRQEIELPFGKVGRGTGIGTWQYVGAKPIHHAALIDAAGKSIDLHLTRSFRAAIPGEKREFHTIFVVHPFEKNQAPTGTLRLTYFDHIELYEIPFDLEIGVGF